MRKRRRDNFYRHRKFVDIRVTAMPDTGGPGPDPSHKDAPVTREGRCFPNA